MNRAAFLDRDGVINALVWNPEEGIFDSPYKVEDFHLLPGVHQAIHTLNDHGFLVVVVSNQPGIAKGKCPPGLLSLLDARMKKELSGHGAQLDGIYYCLHHPEAKIPSLRVDCDCRKPKPGLLLQAAQELGIDLRRSYLIGDRAADIQAGKACGCHTALCLSVASAGLIQCAADMVVPSLVAAVEEIERLEGRRDYAGIH